MKLRSEAEPLLGKLCPLAQVSDHVAESPPQRTIASHAAMGMDEMTISLQTISSTRTGGDIAWNPTHGYSTDSAYGLRSARFFRSRWHGSLRGR